MARPSNARMSRLSASNAYWTVSRKPLQILAFLLPLIIVYELALTFLLQEHESVRTVLAHSYLLRFFDAFNIAPQVGLHLGGIAIVLVLLIWHVLNSDPWRVDVPGLAFMAVEVAALSMPLLVLGHFVNSVALPDMPTAAAPPDAMAGVNLWSKMAIGVGAGLYEELVFRMMLLAVVHTLLVDLCKASAQLAMMIAVAVSAAAFACYHPLNDGQGRMIARLAFYFAAGLYFGAIYVTRGFGVVVGVHALYDLIAIALRHFLE